MTQSTEKKEMLTVYYLPDGHPESYSYCEIAENEIVRIKNEKIKECKNYILENALKWYDISQNKPEPYFIGMYNKYNDIDLNKVEFMPFDEFFQKMTDYYANKPICEITEDNFYRAFGELPPKKYSDTETGFQFFCSEFQESSFTDCYLKHNNRYFTKTVNICDSKTYLANNIDKIEEIIKGA